MSEVFNIKNEIDKRKKQESIDKTDAQASYIAMEKCLKILEMNSMSELRGVKAMLRKTMKQMIEIGKNGKKERSW